MTRTLPKKKLPDNCIPAVPHYHLFNLTIVIFKNTHEFLACEENPALDRAELKIEILGNLLVFKTVDMHTEGETVVFMQSVNGLLNFIACI